MPSIEDKVREIIVEQLEVEPGEVSLEASFVDDLGADSLLIVDLVMAFEEQFEIEIPDEDSEQIKSVGSVVNYLKGRIAES